MEQTKEYKLRPNMSVRNWVLYYKSLTGYKNLTLLQQKTFDFLFPRLLAMPIFESDDQLASTYGLSTSTLQHSLKAMEDNKLIIRNNEKEQYFDKTLKKEKYRVKKRSIILNSVLFPKPSDNPMNQDIDNE